MITELRPPAAWEPDTALGGGFVKSTLALPADYDGPVVATLVRNDPPVPRPRGAVLYIHGFIDYFFQAHVADAFTSRGWNFYALDLRRYGRSLRRDAHPNFCHRLDEYFPEVTRAIEIITADGHDATVLYGHSTGGLTAALYAAEGRCRDRVARLILNSPFLDFRQPRWQTRAAAAMGKLTPFWPQRNPVNRWYGRSLHASARGEWDFDLAWKPLDGFDAYLGWVRGIVLAHDRVAAGLGLRQPVLAMHSDRSSDGDAWSDEFLKTDLVLDVDDIRTLSPTLGANVTVMEIAGGVHDLVLSARPVRDRAIGAMLDFVS